MTTIHALLMGDQALVSRSELEQLVGVARQSEQVELLIEEQDVSTADLMRLAETGSAFDFWHEEGEDIYSVKDGEPV